MKIFGRFFTALGVIAVVLTVANAPAAAAYAPVLVKKCNVLEPKPLSKKASGTEIDYIIYGKKNASAITFAVGYQNAAQPFLRTVTDYGTFSPGTLIQHKFSLYNDVTYAGKQTKSCVPIKVKWADATLWVAPAH
jgi:hypothetical protein